MLLTERGAALNTRQAYWRDLADYSVWLRDNKSKEVEKATTSDIKAYLKDLGNKTHTKGEKSGTIGNRTVARRLSALRQFYRFMISEDVLTEDPTTTIESPKQTRTLPKTLTEKEIDTLINVAGEKGTPESKRLVCLLEMIYATGLRVSELVGLPMSAIGEDTQFLMVEGKGGHAALPHMSKDAITIGSQIVVALQTIVSRKLDPVDAGVVSVTEFITDGKKNILPGHGLIKGDARAFSEKTNKMIEKNMRQLVKGICDAYGISYEVSYETTCPMTLNHPKQAESATKAALKLLGKEKINGDIEPRPFSEDFSVMTNVKPGCFVLMGNGKTESYGRPLHSADYDFNDKLLVAGSSYWVELAEQQLKSS